MNTRHGIPAIGILIVAILASGQAAARDTGDWILRVGFSGVMPKSTNLSGVPGVGDIKVDDGYMLTFNGTYMLTPNWGVEVLASLPFKHDVGTSLAGNIGEVKHLPPTVSAQYHFPIGQNNSFYIGAGLNYTIIFDEKTEGAIAGSSLKLDNSFGFALQLGADFVVSDNLMVNFDARWIDIEAEAKLDGASLGDVAIDPLVIGIHIARAF